MLLQYLVITNNLIKVENKEKKKRKKRKIYLDIFVNVLYSKNDGFI